MPWPAADSSIWRVRIGITTSAPTACLHVAALRLRGLRRLYDPTPSSSPRWRCQPSELLGTTRPLFCGSALATPFAPNLLTVFGGGQDLLNICLQVLPLATWPRELSVIYAVGNRSSPALEMKERPCTCGRLCTLSRAAVAVLRYRYLRAKSLRRFDPSLLTCQVARDSSRHLFVSSPKGAASYLQSSSPSSGPRSRRSRHGLRTFSVAA